MKPKFQKEFPHLKAVDRISKIPVFETGYNFASDLYYKIKKSNGLFTWSLNSAEAGFMLAIEITLPAVSYLEAPLHTVDNIICRSLDIVEERVPAINYPPKVIYHKTKDYVSTKVVQPVLKRADSVKHISLNSASKYSEMAASRLDNALNVADKYVDKYLPDVGDNPSDAPDSAVVEGGSKTAQTIHHVNQFSRKLQRRLTRRTIAEARALKQQSADTLQCLIYLADLLARDPKAFMEKARKMWEHLSEDEPENQVPPANLEQLIAMLTREVARRIVHLVNYTGATVSQVPHRVGHNIHVAAHNINSLADYVLKKVHLESMKVAAVAQAKLQFVKAQQVVNQIKVLGINLLERILSQINLATNQLQASYPLKQITPAPKPQTNQSAGNSSTNNSSSSPSTATSQTQNSNNDKKQPKTSNPQQGQNQNNSVSKKKKEKEQENVHHAQEVRDGKDVVE
ncbi:lipid storage droplet-1 isoform X2 [Lycorma delicatula]|uniref:lipid storage droplet-1 isoform X2 n=1 Tax=Lycorma delicatula TaxID=130591 RepID=UPI003F51965F